MRTTLAKREPAKAPTPSLFEWFAIIVLGTFLLGLAYWAVKFVIWCIIIFVSIILWC